MYPRKKGRRNKVRTRENSKIDACTACVYGFCCMTSGAMNMGVPVIVVRPNVVFDICAETPKSAEKVAHRREKRVHKTNKNRRLGEEKGGTKR